MNGEITYQDTLIDGPTIEPLDLAEVKKALKFTPTSEDTLIDMWISAARQYFEEQTGRQLLTARRSRRLACAPCQRSIELPFPPLQSVVSVRSEDDDGDLTVFDASNYVVLTGNSGPTCPRGTVRLVSGASWPTGALTIEYLCGYGAATGDVPELAKAALYFLVGHFHKFRAEVQEIEPGKSLAQLPIGAKSILESFKWSAKASIVARTTDGAAPWV